jgi:hypothetical protein
MRNKQLLLSYSPGVLSMTGSMRDLEAHRHHALQIICFRQPDDLLTVKGTAVPMNEITIICPGVEHRYQSAKGAVLLISPETHLSKELIARYIPHEESGYACIDRIGSWSEPETPIELLEGFLTHLAPTGCLKFHVDKRFSRLLKEVLQRILEGDILDADLQWACTQVHLSESRFMHRFKELVGIPWRSYLLWSR